MIDLIERLRDPRYIGQGIRQEAADQIERLRAEIERLEATLGIWQRQFYEQKAEIARLQELLRGVGANRYWEGRWRDEVAVSARLLAALKEIAENGHDVEACAYARDALRRDVQVKDGSE